MTENTKRAAESTDESVEEATKLRAAYSTPILREFGSVRALTLGGGGSKQGDAGEMAMV